MNLDIQATLQPVTLLFHQHLAEIVIGNLLGNAIRYNIPGGAISIVLQAGSLTISNTAAHGQLDATRLFNRFYMHDSTAGGTGLGLSIVRQVCYVAGFSIAYSYQAGRHCFTMSF